MINKQLKEKIVQDYKNGESSVKIAKKYGLRAPAVCSTLDRMGIKRRSNKINSRKYYYDESYFSAIDTPDKAYWLGFIYADGYVSSVNNYLFGAALSNCDKGHLYKLQKSLKSNTPVKTYRPSASNYSTNGYCRIIFIGSTIYNDLVSHGVIEHKTLEIMPPNISSHLVSHFIRGYFDGDGCHTHHLTNSPGKSEMHHYRTDAVKFVGTESLLTWIEDQIYNATGIHSNGMFKRRTSDSVFSLEYQSIKKSFYILNYLYENAETYLDRKFDGYVNMLSYIYSRTLLKRSGLKSLELSGKPLELAKLQHSDEISTSVNA